jgi:CBS domain-containing protein
MRPAMETLLSCLTVSEAYQKAHSSKFRTWPVISDRGVVGVINSSILERAVAEGPDGKRLNELFDERSFPHVHPDHSLYWALERMGAAKLDLLPVVDRSDMNKMEGIVTLKGLLRTYGLGPDDLGKRNEVDPGAWPG